MRHKTHKQHAAQDPQANSRAAQKKASGA